MGAQAGGFLAQPPGFDGEPGLGIPGVSGVPRGRTWDAVASAHAPDLPGETVTFVALGDGTLLVEEDVPDDSLAPLADAVEQRLAPPYRAAALRNDGDVWAAVAESIAVVELPQIEGDAVDLSVVDGVRELTVDDEPTIRPLPALDAIADEHGDVSLHAERVDGSLFAVDVFPL
jgi:hypothetical protein